MEHAGHRGTLPRLKRIEGQVRGLVRMVEEERYCVDILTQVEAVRAALKRVADRILHDHVEHCVAGALRSGDVRRQQKKIEELMQVLGRYGA